jgi:hypothetical protein
LPAAEVLLNQHMETAVIGKVGLACLRNGNPHLAHAWLQVDIKD